ncbi:MAG: P-loop NTPase fold protein [Pseudomonadota bacterium]
MSTKQNPYQPLDDLPWCDPDKGDAARLHTIRDQLHTLIRTHLSGKIKPEPLCIGLFGGLGQGKTSTWKQAQTLSCDEKVIRYCVFEATAYPAQMLDQEFDRFIARWTRPLWSKILLVILALTVTTLSVKTLKNLWRKNYKPLLIYEIQRDHHLQKCLFETLKKWWIRTDVLIIDDMDRLPLAKQRSLLRTLHNFRHYLPPVTLIAFDEHPLLNSRDDPETPAELLHKVLDVKLRLPPRMPEDCAALAQDLSAAAAAKNPNCACLRDPVLIGDLAAVSACMPHISPRLVKLLINNTLLHAAQLGTTHAEDVGALLRLHALQTLAHQFTDDHMALARLFEKDHQDLTLIFHHYFPGLADHPDKHIWCRFLTQTRGIQPLNGDWYTLIAVQPQLQKTSKNNEQSSVQEPIDSTAEKIQSEPTDPEQSAQEPFSYAALQSTLSTIQAGCQAQINYANLFIDEYKKVTFAWPTIWATLRTICATTLVAPERLRLFRFWQQELKNFRTTDDFANLRQRLIFALYRLWISDVAVYQISTQAEHNELMAFTVQNKQYAACLLTQFPPHTLPLSKAIQAIIDHADNNPARQWHERTLRQWLSDCVLSDDSLPQSASQYCGFLGQCWPPLDPATEHSLSVQFTRQCRLLGALADNTQYAITPHALSQQLWQEGLWATLTHNRYDLQNTASALDALCPGENRRTMTAWLQLLPALQPTELQLICQPVLDHAHTLDNMKQEMMFLAIAALDKTEWLKRWLDQYSPWPLNLQTARTLLYSVPFYHPDHCLWSLVNDEHLTTWFRLDEGSDNPLYHDLRIILPKLIPSSHTKVDYLNLRKKLKLPFSWSL